MTKDRTGNQETEIEDVTSEERHETTTRIHTQDLLIVALNTKEG